MIFFVSLFVLLCFWTIRSGGPAYYTVNQTNVTECTCKALGFLKLCLIVLGPIGVISISLLGLETGNISTDLPILHGVLHTCNIL